MRIIHISDIHLFCPEGLRFENVLNKRLLGLANWYIKRKRRVDYGLLDLATSIFSRLEPDLFCITGDIVHLGLKEEFTRAVAYINRLEKIAPVKIVPGNHDVYIKECEPVLMSHLGRFFDLKKKEREKVGTLSELFPRVDIVKDVAFVGVSTATPCSVALATGTIGKGQLNRLSKALKGLARQGLLRVILIHHPPITGVVNKRRALTDLENLKAVIKDRGGELFLFGHSHKRFISDMTGHFPKGLYLGAPSLTSVRKDVDKRAGFYLIDITKEAGTWNISCQDFILAPEGGAFEVKGRLERHL